MNRVFLLHELPLTSATSPLLKIYSRDLSPSCVQQFLSPKWRSGFYCWHPHFRPILTYHLQSRTYNAEIWFPKNHLHHCTTISKVISTYDQKAYSRFRLVISVNASFSSGSSPYVTSIHYMRCSCYSIVGKLTLQHFINSFSTANTSMPLVIPLVNGKR